MIEVSVKAVSSYMSLWHPTKNVGVNHNSRSHKITDQVWWRCKKGHEWKASIASIIWGNDCPKCRTRPSSVENNLSSTHPEIAKEWHPTKNKPYEPDKVLPMARLKFGGFAKQPSVSCFYWIANIYNEKWLYLLRWSKTNLGQ